MKKRRAKEDGKKREENKRDGYIGKWHERNLRMIFFAFFVMAAMVFAGLSLLALLVENSFLTTEQLRRGLQILYLLTGAAGGWCVGRCASFGKGEAMRHRIYLTALIGALPGLLAGGILACTSLFFYGEKGMEWGRWRSALLLLGLGGGMGGLFGNRLSTRRESLTKAHSRLYLKKNIDLTEK